MAPSPRVLAPGEVWTPPGIRPITDPAQLVVWTRFADSMRAMLATVREATHSGVQLYADWSPQRANLLHEKQARLWYSGAGFIVYMASNRNGKTHCGAALDIFSATCVPPAWFLHPARVPYLYALPWPVRPPVDQRAEEHRFSVIVITPNADARDKGVAKYIMDFLPGARDCETTGQPSGWCTEVRTDSSKNRRVSKVATFAGDIWFLSQDLGIAAVAGVQADVIHEDEELEGELGDRMREELRPRLTDRRGRYRLTSTAVNSAHRGANTPLINQIVRPLREGTMPLDQRRKYALFQSHIDENPFLGEAEKETLKDSCRHPVTKQPNWLWKIRVEGDVLGAHLSPVIEPDYVSWQRQFVRPYLRRANLTDRVTWRLRGNHTQVAAWLQSPVSMSTADVEAITAENGDLWIYAEPVKGHHYIVGGDVGTGRPGGNPSVAVVFDRTTGEVVAILWGRIDPSDYMFQLIRLGHFYNTAWLVPENTPVSAKLCTDMCDGPRYPRIYIHERPGTYGEMTRSPGYPMESKAMKEFMIATVNGALKPEKIGDMSTVQVRVPIGRILDECDSAMRDDKKNVIYPEVEDGEVVTHCDALVSFGLALIGHNARACPLPLTTTKRAPLPDPRDENAYQFIERELEKQRRAAQSTADWEETVNPMAGWEEVNLPG
jgi:hypothetical protein